MKITNLLITIASVGILASCGMKIFNRDNASTSEQTIDLNDDDLQACLTSGGYAWSELWNKSISPKEEGVEIVSNDNPALSGYFIFSSDSSKVELFLPDGCVILDRRKLPNGNYVWNTCDDDTKQLSRASGLWQITQRNKAIFSQR